MSIKPILNDDSLKVSNSFALDFNTGEELLEYVRVNKIANENTQNYKVLQVLLLRPEGLCRLCLANIFSDEGNSLGQGGSRVIQTLRDKGFNIEKGVNRDCVKHGLKKPFDKLEKPYLLNSNYHRTAFSKKDKIKISTALGGQVDGFTGLTAEEVGDKLEIDHRRPVQRRILSGDSNSDIVIDENVSDETIRNEYQYLSRKNNIIKRSACSSCMSSGVKPNLYNKIPLTGHPGIGEPYVEGVNDCSTCFFAHPEKYELPRIVFLG